MSDYVDKAIAWTEVAIKNDEIAEWKQAARVEANLRREFLERAVNAEAKLADAIKVIRAEVCPFKDGPMADGWAEAWAAFLNRLEDPDGLNKLYANSLPVGRMP